MTIDSRSRSERQNNSAKFDPNHFAFIKSSVHPNVVARLPEEVPLTISSEWESPLAGTFSGLKAKTVDFTLREAAGLTLKNQLFTSQIWSGSSPIEMTVPLEFYADRNPYEEVIAPILALAKMALPRYNNTKELQKTITVQNKTLELKPLTAPGPLILENQNNNIKADNITIQLGNFLKFSKIIITDVNINFNTRDLVGVKEGILKEGKPLRASCEVTFRTVQSLTGEDLVAMFI